VYDYEALHLTFTTVRIALACVALAFWILYFHEILFRSGRVRTQWVKKGLADVLLMLSIALVTFLIFTLMGGFQSAPHRPR
jgi:hypothetical protein